jgi:hypothetical protein
MTACTAVSGLGLEVTRMLTSTRNSARMVIMTTMSEKVAESNNRVT